MRRFETHKAQKYPDRERGFGAYFSLIHSAFSAKCGSFRPRPFRCFVWLVNRAVHHGFLDFANPCPKAPRPNFSREFTTNGRIWNWGGRRHDGSAEGAKTVRRMSFGAKILRRPLCAFPEEKA